MVGQTYLDRRHNFLYNLYRVTKKKIKKNVLLDAGATSLIGFLLQESELFLQSYVYVKSNKTAQKSHNVAGIKWSWGDGWKLEYGGPVLVPVAFVEVISP